MKVYRIIHKALWDTIEDEIPLDPIDIQDGYIHLSSVDSVLETANLYFTKDKALVVLVFESECFGSTLKWEYVESRGVKFPHVYDECLRKRDVLEVVSLVVEEGRFVWE
jgi:uncharacterized protein (DUF952 family)